MRRIPAWGVLSALVLGSTLVRAWAGLRVPSPWIAADEMIYAELGRSLWETGRLDVVGADTAFYSLVHPALIGLPLAVLEPAAGYDIARLLQALVMSLTAVPVFLWGRTLMSERWALVAAGLTVTIPGLAYSGLLMTETVFYPTVTLAAWAAARVLAVPTRWGHALFVGAVVLAVLTRLQALVLVPAFVLAVAFLAGFERSTAPVRRAAPSLVALLGLAVLWLATGGLGAYEPAGEAGYDAGDALRFVLYHAGDALLLVGLAPACAVALLALHAWRGSEPSDRLLLGHERAYLAVTVALVLGLVAEVGIFASRYVGRLAERDLLAVAPLLFLGLCLWLDRGAPRSRISASAVALIAAGLVVFLPYGRLVHKAALTDAFMLVPLWHLGSFDLVVGLAVAAVVLLFVLVPRTLPAALAALFVAVSISASRFVDGEAETLRASFFGADPAWIDAAADGDVTYFYDGEPHWNAVWAHVFWNRRIRDVVALSGKRVPGPLPQRMVMPRADGALSGSASPYVVGSTAFTFFGEPVAQIEQSGLVQKGLVLWRVDGSARISTVVTGVQASGDIYGPARIEAYDCSGGTFELTLIAKGAPVNVRLGTHGAGDERTLSPEEIWRPSVPATPLDGRCILEVGPSGLIGSTRFEFVRG